MRARRFVLTYVLSILSHTLQAPTQPWRMFEDKASIFSLFQFHRIQVRLNDFSFKLSSFSEQIQQGITQGRKPSQMALPTWWSRIYYLQQLLLPKRAVEITAEIKSSLQSVKSFSVTLDICIWSSRCMHAYLGAHMPHYFWCMPYLLACRQMSLRII